MCGENDIMSSFKGLIVDCDGCFSINIEPTEITGEDIGCEDDVSLEDIFFRLLNTAGDAIKTTIL